MVEISEQNIESLGFKLRDTFNLWESYRQPKEDEWLQSLRQHNGVYDPEVESKLDVNRSRVYPKITRSKDISIEARLHEISFPDVGKAWGIAPTPHPVLSPEAMEIIMSGLRMKKQGEVQGYVQEVAAQGQRPDERVIASIMSISNKELDDAIKDYARKSCNEMEVVIDDQLIETNWISKAKEVMRSGIYLGTGIMKNPTVSMKKETSLQNISGQFQYVEMEVPTPHIDFVRVWDVYPDMSVVRFEDAEGIFERHVMTKHELRKLAKRPDFQSDVIYEYLRSNPAGDTEFKSWEVQLQEISTEIGRHNRGRKYEVLEYWGYADASDLSQCGVPIPDGNEDMEFEANVWLLGHVVIKAVLSPLPKDIPVYSVFYYEKDDSSIFGRGMPVIMRDSQETICAAARMMLDNAAICAAPQLELNYDLMDDEQDYDNIYPLKIWLRKGRGQDAQYPAIRPYNMDSHIAEYQAIIKQFMDFADLETAFPTYMLIEPTRIGNETAQGVSIRHSTVNVTVKDIAKNWDLFVENILKAMYKWNIEFNDNNAIKGDYQIKATGLSSLVAKEIRANVMQNLNATLQPDDKSWIKKRDFLAEMWKVLDLPLEILRTEEEFNKFMQESTDPRQIQLQIDHMQAEIDKMKSLALANAARAKKTNIEAIEMAEGQPQMAKQAEYDQQARLELLKAQIAQNAGGYNSDKENIEGLPG